MVSITSTMEDYLEVILNIVTQNGVARSMEIAEKLNVKRPTVTVALRSLAEKGMVNYSPGSYVTLTETGKEIARHIEKRHNALKDFFINVLNVPETEADEVACKMEHGMGVEVCKKLNSFLRVLEKNKALADELKKSVLKENANHECVESQKDSCHNFQSGEKNDKITT
ncbi:Iron-dependent repressor IdeR/DtxR [Chitinispirillum alkaliphilum]|nr:Iron-dependent repressor IdeR/DtxR [Chitinispirillum alkaliphilum]